MAESFGAFHLRETFPRMRIISDPLLGMLCCDVAVVGYV